MVVLAGMPLFIVFEEHHGPALWVAAALFFFGARHWSRRQLTVASTAAYLIAVHVALTCALTCWTYNGRSDEFPVLAMHPGFLVAALLDDHPQRWFRTEAGFAMVPAYWLALAINIAWLRRWVVNRFDVLAERTSVEPGSILSPGPEQPADVAPATV